MDDNNESNYVEKCSVEGVKPAMAEGAYPIIQVEKPNKYYAHLLSIDYAGAVSEFTAVAQYTNHEMRLTNKYCEIARTVLAISKTEMMHLQMLGELIVLLGEHLTYNVHYNKKKHPWTSKYVYYKTTPEQMILADIEAEKQAIKQYKEHMNLIGDQYINKVIERIIKDEENHILLFNECLNSL